MVPRHTAASLLALALLGGCAPPSIEGWQEARILAGHPAWQRAATSVASITVTVPGLRGYREGSGFFVGSNLLVTDFHVVAEVDRLLTIRLPDGTVLPWARVRLISRVHDLALIETPPAGVSPLPLAHAPPQGDQVLALAGRWVHTACGAHAAEGTVLGVARRPRPGGAGPIELVLLSPTSVCQGFSGGPVLNGRGQVVGVVRGILKGSAVLGASTLSPVDAVPAATAVRHVRDALAELGQ